MRIIAIILTSVFLSIQSYAQIDSNIWDSLKTIKTENYEFKVPLKWRQLQTQVGQGPEQLIEGSGLGFPSTYNGSPVIVTVFFVKSKARNLEEAKDNCLRGYKENPDREFPENYNSGQEKIAVMSDMKGYFLNTKFYRKSKGLNQSRFDLIVFSEKTNSSYMYTLSIQYNDKSYKFEDENNLNAFAKKLYSYFQLII